MRSQAAKKLRRFWTVTKPPKVRQKRQTIDVNMLRLNQLEQTHAAVSPAVAAVFDATPRCLRDAVSVDDFVDHHRSRFNAFRKASSSGDVPGPDAGS